jgi:hypothetical protein
MLRDNQDTNRVIHGVTASATTHGRHGTRRRVFTVMAVPIVVILAKPIPAKAGSGYPGADCPTVPRLDTRLRGYECVRETTWSAR